MVTTSPTLAQVESTTRKRLLEAVLREGRIGAYGTVDSGSTSTIVDAARLKSTQFNDQDWVGGWIRISSTTDDAAPLGEISTITTYAPSTGTITFDPVMSAGPGAGDTYELWKFPNPQDILDMIDELLKEDIWLPSWTMLSEVPDGDMEQNNTTDWTDSGATGSKVTTEPAMMGSRWLEVVGSSALDYTRTAVMNVEPGHGYYAGAMCVPIGNFTGRLIAYDETNSAEIDSVDHDGRYLAGIGFDFTAPATCEQISLRLAGVEASATVRWDEVVLYPSNPPDIALPWWVKNKNQVKGVFHFERWQSGSDVRFPRTVRGLESSYNIMDDAFGRGQLRLFKGSGRLSMPLMMYGTRNPGAFADDATAIRVDFNYLKSGVLWKLFDMMNNDPIASRFETSWLQDRAQYWEREWTIASYQQMERIEETIQTQEYTRVV